MLPGPGFGLSASASPSVDRGRRGAGFQVRAGEFNWSGIARHLLSGSTPSSDFFAVLMMQAPRHRIRYRAIDQGEWVYDALVGKAGDQGRSGNASGR